MPDSDNFAGSSTAVEVYVQLPPQPPIPPYIVKFRGSLTTPPSQLDSGNPDQGAVSPGLWYKILSSGVHQILDVLNSVPSLGSHCVEVVLACLSAVCTNVLLFRRPLSYASELGPILEQARNCRDQAAVLCINSQHSEDVHLPDAIIKLKESWSTYLEDQIQQWTWHTRLVAALSVFVLVALQMANEKDPATRVLACITLVAMFFCIMITQNLFPRYLDHKLAHDVHYVYHLLEHADDEISSTWNIYLLLSMSSVSAWWVTLFSGTTFTLIFYHLTETKTFGSSEEVVPLKFWQMIVARAAMVTCISASGLCLVYMQATLERYGKAIQKKHVCVAQP